MITIPNWRSQMGSFIRRLAFALTLSARLLLGLQIPQEEVQQLAKLAGTSIKMEEEQRRRKTRHEAWLNRRTFV